MRQSDLTLWLSTTFAIAASFLAIDAHAATPAPTAGTLGQTPLYFTENKGQWDERVLYKADGGAGLTWWFERDGLTLAVTVPDTSNPLPARLTQPLPARRGWQNDSGVGYGEPTLDSPVRPDHTPPFSPSQAVGNSVPRKGHALKLRFVPSPSQTPSDLVIASTAKQSLPTQHASEVIPEGKLGWNNNYFLGNDSSKWAPDCGNFTRLTYRNVWPGVDVVYYGEGDHLKYDYVVKPGADPADVRLRWLGLGEPLVVSPSSLTASDSGAAKDGGGTELLLATSVGTLREALPLAYQRDAMGNRVPIAVTMKVLSDNEFGLEVVGAWDRGKELVVDPLVWSTFLGGGGHEEAQALFFDGEGGAVVAGITNSEDFPVTEGAFDRSFNRGDAFIARLNAEGSELLYATYLGGGLSDWGQAIVPDGVGGVIVAGQTNSNDFPTTQEAYQRNNGREYGLAGFIARLSGDGRELLYGTYLGGRGNDEVTALVLDEAGCVVVAGLTDGNNFPTTEEAFDRSYNGRGNHESGGDAFVARLSGDLSELHYSTYLGGNDYDKALALITDGAAGVVVAGFTASANFPIIEGAFQDNFGSQYETFVARLSEDGSELVFSTYLGGQGSDFATALAPDGAGGVIVAGETSSDDFPMTDGAFDRSFNGGEYDAFVARLSENGSELLYSTYLGGGGSDGSYALAPDGAGGVIVTGLTDSNDFPTTEGACAEEYNGGECDAFAVRLNSEGDALIYSTYLGGRFFDKALALASDSVGGVVMAGWTSSNNFPTTDGAFDESHNGGQGDVFVARLNGLAFLSWVDIPDSIRVDENSLIEFPIVGECSDINKEIAITYASNNLPQAAAFEDNRNGTGIFAWQTTFDDAGEYTAVFILSDGENATLDVVRIIVNDVNHVVNPKLSIPTEYFLADAFPNPFNSSTTIRYGLPVAGEVSLSVYDLSGKKVADLVRLGGPTYAAGWHEVVWEATGVPGGVYLIKMQTAGGKLSKRVALIK